jgi:serine/threonine-protein kinase
MRTDMYATGTRRMGQATQVAGATGAIPPYGYGQDDGHGSDYDEPPRRRVWPWVLVGAIVLLLIAGGIYAFKFASDSGGGVSVPSVDNMTRAKAEAAIVKANLVVGTVTFKTSATVPAHHVISTSPPNGTNVKAHSTVDLVVSKGVGTTPVPKVTGLTESAAEAALTQAGLTPVSRFVQSSRPQGTVVSQSPKPNVKVPPGSSVRIDISQGGVKVPSVIGESQSVATTTLQNDGFTVQVVTGTPPNGFAAGTVFATNPTGGAIVPAGSTITISVASAPTSAPPTTPPPTTTSPPPTSPPVSTSPPTTP